MDINTLIPILVILIYSALLVTVSFSRQQPHIRGSFQIYLLSMFAWTFLALILQKGVVSAQVWYRLIISCEIGSILSLFHLLQVILPNRRSWTRLVYILGLGVMAVNSATDWMVRSASITAEGRIAYEYTHQFGFILVPGFALVVFSLVDLFRFYRQADDPNQRNRLRYLIVSMAILSASLLSKWTPAGRYPIDLIGSGLSAFLITFAVLKHHLIDIEVIFRRILLYTIPATIIGAGYFLLINLALNLFNAVSGLQLLIISMIVAILSAIAAQPLNDRIQAWVDRRFFREKYDSQLMLQRISRTATTFLEVNMLANMILDEISTTMSIKRSAFFLKDKHSNEFRLIVHRNLGKNTNIRLSSDHPIVLELNISDKAICKRDTEILPQFKSLWEEERSVLEKIDAELYIPLRSQGGLIGILAVGKKRADKPYSQDEQSTLTTLGNQVAVAIENARLYTNEQTRRKELDSLYSLSRKLIATDEMDKVLQLIVEHALESIHVTFTRILLRNEDGIFICRATHPVVGLNFNLGVGKADSETAYRHYEKALQSGKPLVLDRNRMTLSYGERKSLFMDMVQSLCICPLRIGGESLGILIMGERRHASRESFDTDKLRLASAIADQASSAIWRARLHEQLEESFVQTILALANALDAKDNYTSDHGERLAQLATATARRLNCSEDEIKAIDWAMRLHDIGKIGVPDEILQKRGPLTDEEWQLMKKHPEIGANIISPIKNLQPVVPLILHHHEKFNGSGYPHNLKGEKIPLGARILSIVDTYGAITDDRVYRKARSHSEAILEIERCTGTQFDPRVTSAFKEVMQDSQMYKTTLKRTEMQIASFRGD